jgi:steroid 5-alpha reductase family enzyme
MMRTTDNHNITTRNNEMKTTAQVNSTRASSILVLIVVFAGAGAMAWAGSQGGVTIGGFHVFALIVGWIFLVQIIAFIPAWICRTEKFFDLTGSLTYISAILMGLFLSGNLNVVTILVAIAVVFWALRLGTFLFTRMLRTGSDKRFDETKTKSLKFFNVWIIQGLWVTITLSPALAAVTAHNRASVDVFTLVGSLIWAFGLGIEIIADAQKSCFHGKPSNRNEFIHTGLWSWSRHPNYFGEMTLWLGVAIMAFPVLHGWQYVTLISPVFVAFLLICVSGIPILERKADSQWGQRHDYQEYKSRTSVLVPLPPRVDK